MKVLDNYSTFEEILDGIKEYQVVITKYKLFRDINYNENILSEEGIEIKEWELQKKAKKI